MTITVFIKDYLSTEGLTGRFLQPFNRHLVVIKIRLLTFKCFTVLLGVLAGPVGWLILGGESDTFDCWKPVLHDRTIEPSAGKLIKDVVTDPRIKQASMIP